jgi:hypothetical protein
MKILPEIKTSLYLTFIWALLGLSYTFYVIQVDQGLFAQIAIPFFFLMGQLILGGILISKTYRHRDETSRQFKVVTLIVAVLPIILIFILVPLLGA